MKYYISDLHFFHENIISIDGRDFNDVPEMNSFMIEQWNSKVSENDEVYILGDLSVGDTKKTELVLSQLNGMKYLIVGNHDDYLYDKAFDKRFFKWIKAYKEISDEGRRVVLSHYPIVCYNGQSRVDKNGISKTYMLYGHVHDADDEIRINKYIFDARKTKRKGYNGNEYLLPCNMINCFCMYSDYKPCTLDEWIEIDQIRRMRMVGE